MCERACAGNPASSAVDVGRDPISNSDRRRRRLAVGALGMVLLLAGCTKVGPDFVKPDAPVAEEWTQAGDLTNMDRALGGGGQSREGKGFVSEPTKEQMAERTNWGNILTPDQDDTAIPPRTTPNDSYRWPVW